MKFLCYIAFACLLSVFSCKRTKTINAAKSKTDSLILAFSWTNVKVEDRAETAAMLSHLSNQELNADARIQLYSNLCHYYYAYSKNLAKSLSYADSLINVAENKDRNLYSRQLSLGYYSRADILFALGNVDEAFQNYYTAKKIMDAKKDNCTNGDYCYRIGMVLYKQGKYPDAGSFFKQGFKESLSCKQDFPQVYREQELLNNVALCFSKSGVADSAVFYYEKALKFINQNDTVASRKHPFNVARGVVYGNLGGEYFLKGDYKQAETLLKQSISINIQPEHEFNDAVLTQIKLAKLYLVTNELTKATKVMDELNSNVKEIGDVEITQKYHRIKADYLGQIGDKQKAFDHLSKYIELQESAQTHLNRILETDIYERFQNLDSQAEINVLKREKHLQKLYLFATVIFSIMAISIILLIYFYWKKSRKNVQVLTNLNDKFLEQKFRLEETLVNLENINNKKDSLLRAVAHDLRNPIGGISSLASLMQGEEKDEEMKQQLRLIEETCLNALLLINELIEAAETQNNTHIIDKKVDTDLIHLIMSAIELLRFRAQEKQQEIAFISTEKKVTVNINPEKIIRVISNLITNAIKFSDVATQITVNVILDSKSVQVIISDQGIGIPEAAKPYIFEMFTPAKRIGTQGEKSYGLGLSISKQIINAHGGEIWFEENESGGTMFFFTIPLNET